MDEINLVEISKERTMVKDHRFASLSATTTSLVLISISKLHSSIDWKLPPIYAKYVYKLHGLEYFSHLFIKVHSANQPFTSNEESLHINLLEGDLIDWEKNKNTSIVI